MTVRRLVVEVDIDIDDDFAVAHPTDYLLHDVVMFLGGAIERAEAREPGGPFVLDTDDLTVFYADTYVAELDDVGNVPGMEAFAALPARDRSALALAYIEAQHADP